MNAVILICLKEDVSSSSKLKIYSSFRETTIGMNVQTMISTVTRVHQEGSGGTSLPRRLLMLSLNPFPMVHSLIYSARQGNTLMVIQEMKILRFTTLSMTKLHSQDLTEWRGKVISVTEQQRTITRNGQGSSLKKMKTVHSSLLVRNACHAFLCSRYILSNCARFAFHIVQLYLLRYIQVMVSTVRSMTILNLVVYHFHQY